MRTACPICKSKESCKHQPAAPSKRNRSYSPPSFWFDTESNGFFRPPIREELEVYTPPEPDAMGVVLERMRERYERVYGRHTPEINVRDNTILIDTTHKPAPDPTVVPDEEEI